MKKRIISLAVILTAAVSMFCGIQTSVSADARQVINSAELHPVRTGYEVIDAKVDEILAECGYGRYDTYTVVKNCYDYIIGHVDYGYNGGFFFMGGHPYGERQFGYLPYIPDYYIQNAISPMFEGKGVCDDYAAEFLILTRAIGLESYVYSGETRKASGGYTGHSWNEIVINGEPYIFDTQVEDNVAKGGDIQYIYFCKTEAEMWDRYIWDDMEYVDMMKRSLNEQAMREFITSHAQCFTNTMEYYDAIHRFAENAVNIGKDDVIEVAFIEPMDKDVIIAMSNEVLYPAGLNYCLGEWDEFDCWEIFKDTSVLAKAGLPMVNVTVDGKAVSFADQLPFIYNGRTYVPVRGVMDAMGKRVSWSGNKATLSDNDITLTLTVDDKVIQCEYADGQKRSIETDASPIIVENRVCIPIRAVVEAFGGIVSWDELTQTVVIISK